MFKQWLVKALKTVRYWIGGDPQWAPTVEMSARALTKRELLDLIYEDWAKEDFLYAKLWDAAETLVFALQLMTCHDSPVGRENNPEVHRQLDALAVSERARYIAQFLAHDIPATWRSA